MAKEYEHRASDTQHNARHSAQQRTKSSHEVDGSFDVELRSTAEPLAATNATTASFLEQWSMMMDEPEAEDEEARKNIDEATKEKGGEEEEETQKANARRAQSQPQK